MPTNYPCLTTEHNLDLGVDFTEGGESGEPGEKPRNTGETNYNNSTHMSSKFQNQHVAITRWSPIQLYIYKPARPCLTSDTQQLKQTNYNNSTHMSSEFQNQHVAYTQVVIHPAIYIYINPPDHVWLRTRNS